ncbi:hypothetical protein HK098_003559 [Nowakowskiella sp. JEL0407]|nr:hypothetical protein HK098_003559 [Nowakowskiella sp. JEL0407]
MARKAKGKQEKLQFKDSLESPYSYKWPSLPLDDSEKILESLLAKFSSLSKDQKQSNLILGINRVTRYLHSGIQAKKTPESPLQIILVCKGDLQVPHLYEHIPIMTQLYGKLLTSNSAPLLFGFNKGVEKRISDSLGMNRVSVVGIKAGTEFSEIYEYFRSRVPPPSMEFLSYKPMRLNND